MKSSYVSIFARCPKCSESSTASGWNLKTSRRISKSSASGWSRSSQKNLSPASSSSTVSRLKCTCAVPSRWKTWQTDCSFRVSTPRIVEARSARSQPRGDLDELGCMPFRVHDPELLDEREERLRERRALGARAKRLPVDLLADRTRELEHVAEVRLLLGEREQLARHHVLGHDHPQPHRHHLEDRRALDVLERERAAGRPEDHVDQDAVLVPGLVEPVLRRPVRPEPGALEAPRARPRRPPAARQVDVVLGPRPAAGPDREPAAERERDAGTLEHARAHLHRVDQLLECRLRHGMALFPNLPVCAT